VYDTSSGDLVQVDQQFVDINQWGLAYTPYTLAIR
jgi:hypothetical protein